MKFSAQRLAEAVGGELLGGASGGRRAAPKGQGGTPKGKGGGGDTRDVEAENVCIDSRQVAGGEVFVPIKGPTRDGHDFIEAALKAGAKIYLTEREDLNFDGADSGERGGVAGILVKDTLAALQDLAVHTRKERIGGETKVFAITGTAGKTSAKDLAGAAIGAEATTHISRESQNNHLGVPLTILNTPKNAEVIVAELGASAVGEIAHLAEILQPEVGLITSLGTAHIEGFGSVEAVAQAKAELLEALPPSGTAVLNADEGGSLRLAENMLVETIGGERIGSGRIGDGGGFSILTYGIQDTSPDVCAQNIRLDENLHPSFDVNSPWGEAEVRLSVPGRMNVSNALAALALAGLAGVSMEKAAEGLATAKLSANRMEITKRADGLLIINDTYNANPTSVKAALLELKSLPAKTHTAILGTMKELGDLHDQAHKEIAELAAKLDINLIAYREPAYLPESLRSLKKRTQVSGVLKKRKEKKDTSSFHAGKAASTQKTILVQSDSETLEAASHLGDGDALLLKASRSVTLGTLAQKLV